MPAHNNAIQRPHLRKHYQKWVKTFFDQPANKKRRLQKRRDKAAKIFPRPLENLRPTVTKCTSRYSGQPRIGRGFSLAEIAKVGLNKKFAATVGISIDHRRTNKSEESLNRNVEKLKEYLDKLVVLPKKEGKPLQAPKGQISDATNVPQTVQNTERKVLGNPEIKLREKKIKITKDMKNFAPYATIAMERMNQKWDGKRKARLEAEEK